MTTITIDRATVEQALEALEKSETTVPYEGFGMAHREAERKHQAAITALRAALAQAEPFSPDNIARTQAAWTMGYEARKAEEHAEPEQAPLGAWQPIETAPRDGTWVLLAGGYCDNEDAGDNTRRVVSGQWTDYLNGRTDKLYGRWQFAWYDGGYFGEYGGPTHWMPMPGPAEPTIPLFVGRRSALEKDK